MGKKSKNKTEELDNIDRLLKDSTAFSPKVETEDDYTAPVMDELDFSDEDIEKEREKVLDKINDHINDMKSKLDKDNLADYMLENRILLLEQGKYMLNEYMVTILTTLSSNSRAFEVLAKMIQTVADVNNTVVNIKEDKNKMSDTEDDDSLINDSTEVISNIVKLNMENARKKIADKKTMTE